MDLELTDRLLDWLAFFFSQQDLGWDWDSWSFVADLPDYSTQKVFVRYLLTKCGNMTDIKAFVEQLPETPKPLVSNNRQGVFKYITESKDNMMHRSYSMPWALEKMSSLNAALKSYPQEMSLLRFLLSFSCIKFKNLWDMLRSWLTSSWCFWRTN